MQDFPQTSLKNADGRKNRQFQSRLSDFFILHKFKYYINLEKKGFTYEFLFYCLTMNLKDGIVKCLKENKTIIPKIQKLIYNEIKKYGERG